MYDTPIYSTRDSVSGYLGLTRVTTIVDSEERRKLRRRRGSSPGRRLVNERFISNPT